MLDVKRRQSSRKERSNWSVIAEMSMIGEPQNNHSFWHHGSNGVLMDSGRIHIDDINGGVPSTFTIHSTLAWKIPWMEEPGGLQSMGLLRVGHN